MRASFRLLSAAVAGRGGVVAAAPELRFCFGWVLTALPSLAKR